MRLTGEGGGFVPERAKEKEGKSQRKRRKKSKVKRKTSFAIRGWPLVLTEKDQPIFGAGEMPIYSYWSAPLISFQVQVPGHPHFESNY